MVLVCTITSKLDFREFIRINNLSENKCTLWTQTIANSYRDNALNFHRFFDFPAHCSLQNTAMLHGVVVKTRH